MIRVMVVDDEALVRSGFELILNAAADIEVVATATGSDALTVAAAKRPDVVLLDIRMPDVDGLTILRHLRAESDPPVVAMLTTFDTDDYIISALGSGATGFVLKDTEPDMLAQVTRTLAAGGVVLSPTASTALLHRAESNSATISTDSSRVDLLTERERQVLVLIREGLSNAEIAQQIHLSVGTVKDDVSTIFVKLQVSNRVQAALLAQRVGASL